MDPVSLFGPSEFSFRIPNLAEIADRCAWDHLAAILDKASAELASSIEDDDERGLLYSDNKNYCSTTTPRSAKKTTAYERKLRYITRRLNADRFSWDNKCLHNLVLKDGPEDVLRAALGLGADPAVRNQNRSTPVHVAARWGRHKHLRALLNVFVSLDEVDGLKDSQGRSPEDLSKEYKNEACCDAFQVQCSGQIALFYRDVKTEKNLARLEAILVALEQYWLPLSENPNHQIQKQTVQPGDAFEDTAFKPGFEIVKF